MSIDSLVFMIDPAPQALGDALQHLVQRLFIECEIVVTIRKQSFEKEIIPAALARPRLPALLAQTLQEGWFMRVNGMVSLTEDEQYWFEVDCDGEHRHQYSRGPSYYSRGYLSGIARYAELVIPEDYVKRGWASPDHYHVPALPAYTFTRLEMVFLTFAGVVVSTPEGSPAAWAALVLEEDWLGPSDRVIVYHRSPAGLAQDFLAMYAHAAYGLTTVQAAELGKRFWTLPEAKIALLPPYGDPAAKTRTYLLPSPDTLQRLTDEERHYYTHVRSAEHFDFLEQLDRATAYGLATLPAAALWERLQRALTRLPWVRCFTFPTGSFMLSVDPSANLWQLYAAMVEEFRGSEAFS